MGPPTRRSALAATVAGTAEAFLTADLVNVRYLTGYTGSFGAVLVPVDGPALLATDGRYATQAAAECPDLELVLTRRLAPALLERAAASGIRTVAIEHHRVTLQQFEDLQQATDGVRLVDAGQPVEALRTVKDETEIAALREACRVTDEAFAAVLERLTPGVTESDVAWWLTELMHERGADAAFDSIVAFGPNSARPHHSPTDQVLASGDLVKMDFGAQVAGYHADMTRTVSCGPAADWQRELHALVRTLQADARAAVAPGALPVELNAAVDSSLKEHGYDAAHGLGHGVGLQIHESPFLVAGSTADRLVDRVAVTVEPGIYLPGRGGVRIEDTVLVNASGAESLTASPRELIEI